MSNSHASLTYSSMYTNPPTHTHASTYISKQKPHSNLYLRYTLPTASLYHHFVAQCTLCQCPSNGPLLPVPQPFAPSCSTTLIRRRICVNFCLSLFILLAFVFNFQQFPQRPAAASSTSLGCLCKLSLLFIEIIYLACAHFALFTRCFHSF